MNAGSKEAAVRVRACAGVARIAGIAYELGEERMPHESLAGRADAIARYRMPDDPSLWGFGDYYRTFRPIEALAIACVNRSLANAGIEISDVDALILCSVNFSRELKWHIQYSERILSAVGAFGMLHFGVSLHRCATMLSALQLAEALVASGRHETVLVVTADAMAEETGRFERFAIFSDGAASCLVTAKDLPGFAIHFIAQGQQRLTEEPASEIGGQLAAEMNRQLFSAWGGDVSRLHRVVHDNLFLPIVIMREQMAGFFPRQMYLNNIPRIGHCFAADPLINLVDAQKANPVPPGEFLGIFSGTPGLRIGLIAEAVQG